MDINGIQKLTLLDYPGHCACTVFLAGCNLRCPFCHNSSLVLEKPETVMTEEKFFSFLSTRVGLLDGVCVTGGEPLLRGDIIPFLSKIKEAGFKVKLDTNGFFPAKLKEVLRLGLADYVAMDIKNSLPLYSLTCGVKADTEKVRESIEILRNSGIDHEFRTTCVKDYHTEESIKELASLIEGEERYFLQNFVDSGALIDPECRGLSGEEMNLLLQAARKFVPGAQLRGV